MAKIIATSHLSAAVIKANDHLCFYRMNDEWHVRRKSSLKGKRVKKDPAFRLTMVYAGLLGQASGIASQVFQQIPKEQRLKGLYKKMVSVAMKQLKSGQEIESTKAMLTALFLTPVHPLKPIRSARVMLQSNSVPAGPQQKLFVKHLSILVAADISRLRPSPSRLNFIGRCWVSAGPPFPASKYG